VSRVGQATAQIPIRSAVILVLVLIVVASAAGASGLGLLRLGSTGSEVRLVQEMLYALGYLLGEPDGVYGPNTELSVRNFQIQNGLLVDGKVGPETFARLNEEFTAWISRSYIVRKGDSLWSISRKFGTTVRALAEMNGLDPNGTLQVGVSLRIPLPLPASRGETREASLVPWTTARNIFTIGSVATVIDVETGLAFRVLRRGGSYHADSEPMTKYDTEVIKRMYGGGFSWNRRAIIVQINGYSMAASMNGMPHGEERIQDNGFAGHFCIHFLGSRLHLNGEIDDQHQAMVRRAAGQR